MKSHLGLMLVFSVLVSLVFTFIAKNGARERIKYFLYLLGSFVLLSLLTAWLMYPFPF
jgi:predicted membrane channel-forming protein YqfA (hemolysin III family)